MFQCRVSQKPFEPFMTFGKMPIANGFLKPDQFSKEPFFELELGFCPESQMVQLTHVVDQEKMFHENYAFFSSTSVHMAEHFKRFAEETRSRYFPESTDPFVVEIGSNDGILLQNFAQKKIRHLGIEPSRNVAEVAISKGIRTISKFFDEKVAEEIVLENGQADAFFAANVMCHIPYINSVVGGIRKLLKPRGVLVFEDPYLGDIIEKTSYDQIYDEHVFYFSVKSVRYLMKQHGLEVIDVEPQPVHGGSMRYTIAHAGAYPISGAVAAQLAKEEELGLHLAETYVQFKKNVEKSKAELFELLTRLKKEGKRVVGYGATSKSTTVMNYCGITQDLVEFISDTTPIKQGKFSPGCHVPVKPYDDFKKAYPDYALLFAWNHAREILAKETEFKKHNGKFIVYVPRVQIL